MAKKTATKDSAAIAAIVQVKESIAEADKNYGDGMPYELTRLENELRFYQEQVGLGLLEMGKRLIVIKAHEEHGSWLEVLNRLGIAERSAQMAMLAARKFSNPHTCADLGNSKTRILAVLDEDDVKELETGGEVKGLGTLDDVSRMSVRELREALRKERDKRKREKEAQERAIAQKEAKINELDQQLRYQQPPTKEQVAIAELARLDDDYFHELAGAMAALRKAVDILNRAQCVPGVNVQILSDWVGKYNDEMVLLNGVREEFIDLIDNLHPVTRGGYGAESDVPDLR